MDIVVENKDARLFTTFYENQGKETIILLHGGPGLPDGLTFLLDYFRKYFQVIYFHQRGTLKSPVSSSDFSLEAYVADIHCLADYFKVSKFHLFGHSWGGLYAQLYAFKHPEKLLSLFLSSSAAGTGKHYKDSMLEIAHYNKAKSSLLEWIKMNLHSALGILGLDYGYRKFYRQALINFSRGFLESHPERFGLRFIKAKSINNTIKSILFAPVLPPFTHSNIRITISFGDQDIIGQSKRYVIERFPTAINYTIQNSGHIPWSHNKKAFLKILEDHYGIRS
ncbi:MAG: alpha/beta hydrolase [Bacteroidota bacterium]|nr:alpha/beta hydrolase [Bacteroidota bacterium]